ncbi:MAG: Trk system potassium transporter TrkA [Bacteroidales bacterium]|nr:Trk system potassium transporter TrkA [Bacteroidales bacterium]MBQ2162296.1 Trk system potassium transporter TrkA [Bacteroidales bacterium]MBQ3941662.1 Trk system potassium transporter TrkA [Bacteroidales bacterium]
MKIVIEGAGEIGSHLAKMLRAEANEVTIIDDDAQRLAAVGAYSDVETVLGNPSSIKTIREAGVARADLFIAVYPFTTQEVNIVGALLAKQMGAKRVIARINDEDYLAAENRLLFKELGIELMFYPEKSAADEIVTSLKHVSSSDTMDFAHGKLQISVFKIDEESPMVDLRLEEFIRMMTPEETALFRIIAISRDANTIIPKFDTKFQFGDVVFTVSKREGLKSIIKYFGKTDKTISRVMILGGSPIAEMVARALSSQMSAVKIIEKSKERCIALSEKLPESVVVVNGDGSNSDFLYEEGIRDYDAFIALTDSDESNVLCSVVAKKFGVPRTVAEVENIEYIRLAEEMGVDTVINKKLITAGKIFKFTLSGKARFVKYMSGSNAEIIEYTVAPGSAITKKPIKDLNFPTNAIIAGVVRGSDSFIAVGDTRIEDYDRVAIFALPQTIKEIDKFFKI